MPHYMVSVSGNFAECGSAQYMDVFEAPDEDRASAIATKAFSGFADDDISWSSPRSAEAADHMRMDAYYKTKNIQYVSPHNAPILKAYLQNAFPKEPME